MADDGKGFDSSNATDGIGLQIMRYRARLLGGLLHIEPLERRGTRVRCVLPVVAASSDRLLDGPKPPGTADQKAAANAPPSSKTFCPVR